MKIDSYVQKSVLLALAKSYSICWRELEKKLNESQCSVMEAMILVALYFEKRSVKPSELASSFEVGRSNISHGLRRLEKNKYIKRTLSEDDARSYSITLKASGETIALSFVGVLDRLENSWEDSLGKNEVDQLTNNLNKLALVAQGHFL